MEVLLAVAVFVLAGIVLVSVARDVRTDRRWKAALAGPPVVLEPDPPAAWLERVVRRRVLVHTVEDLTLEGLLDTVAEDGIVLAAGKLITGNATLAGDVFVPRAKIRFVQVTEAEQ